MQALASIILIACSGLFGWTTAKRRGQDPSAKPKFTRAGQYIWRCVWVLALSSAVLAAGLWLILTLIPLTNGTVSATDVLASTTLVAGLGMVFGAFHGIFVGLIYWCLDSVRRANQSDEATVTPPTSQLPTVMPAPESSWAGLMLPPDVAIAPKQPRPTTGDSLWDDFHRTQPTSHS